MTSTEVAKPLVITPEPTQQKHPSPSPSPRPNVMSLGWTSRAQRYAPIINRVAQQYAIDADMLAALIAIESTWDPDAVSVAGACGLTQVMPKGVAAWTAGRPTCDQLIDNPAYAIEYGTHLLVIMYEHENGIWERALGSYLCGFPDSATGTWDTPAQDGHCRDYAQRIMALASSMKTR